MIAIVVVEKSEIVFFSFVIISSAFCIGLMTSVHFVFKNWKYSILLKWCRCTYCVYANDIIWSFGVWIENFANTSSGFFLAQHIHIRVKQHSYQSQLTTHVITRELSLNNYTSQKLGKETKSSRYVKSRSKRNIYRHRKWRHKVQEMVGYIGFCFSDGVSHSKWRKQKAWIFFFNLPPFGDCLIYLGRMVDTLDDQNPCYYKHINQIGIKQYTV